MDIDPRYPIGKFKFPAAMDAGNRGEFIAQIAAAPAELRAVIEGLDNRQLDTPYREGGWTVRQVIHHLPDSHVNAYIRFKLALTETEPLVKTYAEQLWAELPDARFGVVECSLVLLEMLHSRWVECMRQIPAEHFARALRHPDHGLVSLDRLLAMYAWHGRHHVGHIRALRGRMGW